MNKSEFIKAIAEKANFSQKEAGIALDALFAVVEETLNKGDKIQLVGIGTFELVQKAAKEGINPLTKEKVKIEACNAPKLKFGKSFKEKFNS